MFRALKDKINNAVVIFQRKKDSSRKTFHELQQIAYRDSAEFMYTRLSNAVLFTDLYKFWAYAIKQVPAQGALMEFGVFSGTSINFFSSQLIHNNSSDTRTFYGFDSFEGLSETWGGTNMGKGHFDVKGNLPKVNPNVQLVKGWIDKTFPGFVAEKELEKIKVGFIHIDVDTYGPTKIVFEYAQQHFTNGTIIVFDELLGYPGWRDHEYKALMDSIDPFWNYEYIAFCEIQRKDFTSEFTRVAIRITGRK